MQKEEEPKSSTGFDNIDQSSSFPNDHNSHMKEKPVHSSIEEFRNRLFSVSWTQLQHTANL